LNYKQFDQQLFDDNDAPAKDVIKKFLEKHGYIVEEGTQYGIDLIVYKNGKIRFMAEVEVKHSWVGHNFIFPDINVPYRKKKFFEQKDKQVFIMLNDNLTSCIVIDNHEILKSPVLVRKNKFKPNGEKFFVVNYKNILSHFKLYIDN